MSKNWRGGDNYEQSKQKFQKAHMEKEIWSIHGKVRCTVFIVGYRRMKQCWLYSEISAR